MAKRKANVLEVVLIGIFAATILFFSWQAMGQIKIKLVNMSSTEKTGSSGVVSETKAVALTVEELLAQLKAKLDQMKTPTTDWGNRIETAGIIGKLIAELNKTNDADLRAKLYGSLKDLAGKTGESLTDEQAGKCISSPSSCTTLMTVSDFSWSTNVNMNSTYSGGKIPVALTYKYSYINDKGDIITKTLTQNAEVQKEQNALSKGKDYNSFLNTYMDTKFSDSLFTGGATDVQNKINDYLSGTNCELSKSDSKYISFADHKVY